MKRIKSAREKRMQRTGLLFCAPAFLLTAVCAIYPLLYTIVMSFCDYNPAVGRKPTFTGLGNYIKVFESPDVLNSLKVTFIFAFFSVLFSMTFGLLLALMLNRNIKIKGLLRSISILPTLMCGVAIAVCWQTLFSNDFGLFNYILSVLGLPEQNWLGSSTWAMPSLIFVEAWQSSPFVMVLLLAGLQSVDLDLYDAGDIDGTNAFQRFIHITFPQIRTVFFTTLVIRIIDAFKTFEKPFVLTKGGPGNSTQFINLYTYNTAFIGWDMGYGSAVAVLILLICGLMAAGLMLVFMRKD
ncbi:carbohydrate ABC transporter permease [Luxibacter massiliensis]|uniref:carbohydrate ABC transporter permease n=1 Tax=Luxibacter massiliensis TaxID=2219695 RepID=UPI000F058229|nr:sugar ABC transporter permease [Luxibacter massiliensis]